MSDVSEVSINWVTIDITATKAEADASRLYLYGYTSELGKPPSKIQGYTIGARRDDVNTPDKIYVALVASGASEPTTHYAHISPAGPTVTGTKAGDDDSPLKFDSNRSQWYLQVDNANNTIYTTLQANSIYQNLGFTPTTFIRRIPDARDLNDLSLIHISEPTRP